MPDIAHCPRCRAPLDGAPGAFVCRRCEPEPAAAPSSSGVTVTGRSFPPPEAVTVPDLRQPPACAGADGPEAATPSRPENPATCSNGGAAPARVPPPAPPPMANYSGLTFVGEGGMGVVYRAVQRGTGRVVALKFLRRGADLAPSDLARFNTEVQALARVRHEGIVEVFEVGEVDGRPFYSMEFVAGGTAGQRLRSGPVEPREAARVVAGVAEAVEAAHGVRVLHRDLKPANILLDDEGTPRVSDFGLAKLGDDDDGVTVTGAAMGTPGFMAPEQAAGRRLGFHPRTDVYGLGATLYALLCGRPPFKGDTAAETLRMVQTATVLPPRQASPGVPDELEAVCLKCLEKDPARRFATAGEVADELNRWLAGEPTRTRPPTRWGRVKRWARRQRVKLAVAALLPVAVLAAYAADPRRRTEWRLAAGLPVTLVPETGPPVWSEWLTGEVGIADSSVGDGSYGFQTHVTSVLVLVRDPRNDSYRVSAELRHVKSNADDAYVGLFVGMKDVAARPDLRATRFIGFSFIDNWRIAEFQLPHLKPLHGLDVRDIMLTADGREEKLSWIHDRGFPFTPKNLPPNVWRKLVVDVSPAGVTAVFSGPDRVTHGQVRLSAELLEEQIDQHNRNHAPFYPGFAIPRQKWNPRGALGVYAHDSAVAVRNVTVEPRPVRITVEGDAR